MDILITGLVFLALLIGQYLAEKVFENFSTFFGKFQKKLALAFLGGFITFMAITDKVASLEKKIVVIMVAIVLALAVTIQPGSVNGGREE